jgi:hypothetical protein
MDGDTSGAPSAPLLEQAPRAARKRQPTAAPKPKKEPSVIRKARARLAASASVAETKAAEPREHLRLTTSRVAHPEGGLLARGMVVTAPKSQARALIEQGWARKATPAEVAKAGPRVADL